MYQQTRQDLVWRSPQTLVYGLKTDRDIKEHISGTFNTFETTANNYLTSVDKYGARINHLNSNFRTANIPEIPTQSMNRVLQQAHQDFTGVGNSVTYLQTELQKSIEICRGRQFEHRNTIDNNKYWINDKNAKISDLESEISDINDDVNELEREAVLFCKHANSEEEKADNAKTRTVLGDAALILLGIGLAPFTAFWSVPIAAAGTVVNTSVNVAKNIEHSKRAVELRDKAQQKRQRESTLIQSKTELEGEIKELKNGIRGLENAIGDLEEAIGRLTMVVDWLHFSTKITSCVMDSIQEVISVIQEAEMAGNSFVIVQNGLRKHPEKLDQLSQKLMEKFRMKWTALETLVVNSPYNVYQHVRALEPAPSVHHGQSIYPSLQYQSVMPPPTSSIQQNNFSQPATSYALPYSSYAQPPTNYIQPNSNYAQPTTSYAPPYSNYAQPTSYGQPHSNYA